WVGCARGGTDDEADLPDGSCKTVTEGTPTRRHGQMGAWPMKRLTHPRRMRRRSGTMQCSARRGRLPAGMLFAAAAAAAATAMPITALAQTWDGGSAFNNNWS